MKEIKQHSNTRYKQRRKKRMRKILRYTLVSVLGIALLTLAIIMLVQGAKHLFKDPDDGKTPTVTQQPSEVTPTEPAGDPTGEPTGSPDR